jgi:hypothetical protein
MVTTMKKSLIFVFLLSVSFSNSQIISPDSTTPELLWESEVQGFRDLVIHPNGNIIAKRKAEVFELDGLTGKIIREFPDFTGDNDIETLMLSNDSRFILTDWEEINIVDYNSGLLYKKLPMKGLEANFMSDNINVLYVTGIQGKNIGIYNLMTDSVVFHNLDLDDDLISQRIDQIAISNDGKYIAIGGIAKYWNSEYKTLLTIFDGNNFNRIKIFHRYDGNAEVRSIKFSKDGRYVGYHWNWGYLAIYDLVSMNLVSYFDQQNIPTNGVRSFCFVNDSVISISSYDYTQLRNIQTKILYYNANGIGNANGLEFNDKFSSLIVSDWHVGTIKAYDYHEMMTSNIYEMMNNQYFIIHYYNKVLVINNINNNLIDNISISDINGKIIKSLEYNPFEIYKQITINLNLATGAYFIQIQTGDEYYTEKLMVTE